MSRRSLSWGYGWLVAAVCLLTASTALAGDRVRSSSRRVHPAPAVVVAAVQPSAAVTIQIAVTTPTEPATDSAFIKLRGPDGQVRRFAVAGGPEGVASRIVVLRPGESFTLQLAAGK